MFLILFFIRELKNTKLRDVNVKVQHFGKQQIYDMEKTIFFYSQ